MYSVYSAVIMRGIQLQNTFHRKTNNHMLCCFKGLQHIYNARLFSPYFTEMFWSSPLPQDVTNQTKVNSNEHRQSFAELCEPHLAVL